MKKSLFTIIAVMFAIVGFANNKYTIDDNQVESVMEQSTAIQVDLSAEDFLSVTSIQEDKNPWIAVALDFFLGGLGIHRVYLGTPPGIIAGYFFTCGGIFGILPIIDLVVLVINSDDISPYINKKGLIMFN
ncbi:MAG: TM2 domain-containing protein [Marinoscillum sp.]